MPKPQVDGYIVRQEVTRAMNANRAAREALKRLLDEGRMSGPQAVLLAKAASAMGDNLDALKEIDRIITKRT